MRKLLFCLLIMVLLVGSFTCVAASKITVGISIPHAQSEFFVNVLAGARQVIKDNGGIVYEDVANKDVARQIAAVENFIQKGVQIIIIDAVDSYSCIPAVKKANAAGIPIIAVDANIMGGQLATFVSSDNFKCGTLGAEYIAKTLKGKGNVAMFTFPYTTWGLLRENGAMSVFKKYPDIKIVQKDGNAWRDGGPGGVMAATENMMTAHPDLDAIWCYADNPASNAVKAISARKNTRIVVTGTDGLNFALEAIKSGGPFKGTVVQHSKTMGQIAAKTALQILKRKKVPSFVEVPTEWVEQKDLIK
jgi:ribose transport system substrate-binding protein